MGLKDLAGRLGFPWNRAVTKQIAAAEAPAPVIGKNVLVETDAEAVGDYAHLPNRRCYRDGFKPKLF